jgi:hypothetical protein
MASVTAGQVVDTGPSAEGSIVLPRRQDCRNGLGKWGCGIAQWGCGIAQWLARWTVEVRSRVLFSPGDC